MIFVSVGTHEQPFDRLIKYIDNMKKENIVEDEIIIQTGFSTYIPQYCKWEKLFPYQVMRKQVEKARIVITHGGPSSFIMPLQVGKVPIVVPRQKQFNEHVNDHQVEFANQVAERQGNIIVVNDISKLRSTILDYEYIISNMPTRLQSNNAVFNQRFEKIVNDIFKERK